MNYKSMKKAIGNRIRSLREANKESREVFAEKIDISSKFLYEIECGKKGFSVEVLMRISKVLDVSCDYILTGKNGNTVPYFILQDTSDISISKQKDVDEIIKLLYKLCSEK